MFLGLRGPVLRGWAVVLQLQPCDLSPTYLSLERSGPRRDLYRKHFLDLGGLGVRDVRCSGDDLLILAGPTMDLDGRVLLYRWPGGARVTEESVVEPKGERTSVTSAGIVAAGRRGGTAQCHHH